MAEARPPDGPGFQGALEDSLARTAIAEGHQGEERNESHDRDGAAAPGAMLEAAASVVAASPIQDAQSAADATAQTGAGRGASTAQTVSGDTHGHGKPALSSDAKDDSVHANGGPSTASDPGLRSTAPVADAAAAAATAKTDAGSAPSAAPIGEPATPGSTTGLQPHAVTSATESPAGQAAGGNVLVGESTIDAHAVDAAAATAAQPARAAGQPRLSGNQSQAPTTQPSPPTGKTPSPASGSQPANAPSKSAPAIVSSSATVPGEALQTAGETPANSPARPATPSAVRLRLPWLDGSAQSTAGPAKSLAPARANAVSLPSAPSVPVRTPQTSSTTTAASHLVAADTTQAPASATAGTAGDTAPISSPTTPGQAAPAPSAGGQAAPYLANMQETIETIHATVALATRQGAAQAQISLEPAELGALRIHLTQTNEGLLARVSAETAAGAQAIASGQSELHSTLSSLGISLLRLDVGAFAQQEAHAGSQAPQQSQQRATRGGGLPDEAEEATTSTTTTTGTVSLSSNSALIDVLA